MDSAQQKQYNVLLIGDSCLDTYTYTTVDRISPEAPVPVCKIIHEFTKPGMAANVKENLEALGCNVNFLTGELSKKTRIIDKRSNQHMLRIDDDEMSKPIDTDWLQYDNMDAVVLSDYNKGLLTYDNICEIIVICRALDIPIFIDTKKTDLQHFNGSFVKINQLEYETASSYNDNMIVTMGGDSVQYNNKKYHVPKTDVVDVCGAGDTFLSALTFGYLKEGNIDRAIPFAIKAASKTVQKMGVYAPKLEEL